MTRRIRERNKPLVARDGGVDTEGPGVDAARDRLGFFEALLTEPGGDREAAGAVMAEDQNVGFVIEFLMGAPRDLVHGHVGAAFDACGGVLPGFTHVEEEGWLLGGEVGAELVYGDFEVHRVRV